MEIDVNSKIAEAAVEFGKMPAAYQDAFILMIKRLLSEQGKYPVQPGSTGKTD